MAAGQANVDILKEVFRKWDESKGAGVQDLLDAMAVHFIDLKRAITSRSQ